jgi:hypothetical protein
VHIRPGQLGTFSPIPTVFTPTPTTIESPSRIAERVGSQAFRSAVIARLGLGSIETDQRARLFDNTMRVTASDRAWTVALRVEDYTREQARLSAQTSVQALVDAHEPMYRPTIDRLQAQLRTIATDIERTSAERDRLIGQQGAGRGVERFSESVLLSSMISQRDADLRILYDRQASVQELLGPERTFPTGPITDIFVPERRSFPSTPINAAAGGILGALVGGGLALLRRRKR